MLFVNGIPIGPSERFNKDFFRDKVGSTLYAGSPALCDDEVALYEQVLTGSELHKLYRDGPPDFDPVIDKELKHRFEDPDLVESTFKPDANWTQRFDCDFQNPTEQIKEFLRIFQEEIKITTIFVTPHQEEALAVRQTARVGG